PRRLAGGRLPGAGLAAQHASPERREAAGPARGGGPAGGGPGGLRTMDARFAPVRVLEGCRPETLPLRRLLEEGVPTVLKGLVRDWGLVQAGLRSPQAAMDHLRRHYNGRPVQYNWGEPATAGRPFYNEDFTALNCQVRRGSLEQVLDELAALLDEPNPPTYYVASLPVDYCLPGLRADSDLDLA